MISPETHLVVFDMDGVIVDVSESYRESIRQTARLFFRGAEAYDELPDPLFSLEDLSEVKQSGGLNNDWETTYRVISLLLTQIDLPDTAAAAEDAARLRQTILRQCNLSRLSDYLRSERYPLRRLIQTAGPAGKRLIKPLSAGDVGTGNIIKQIFQELYLGKERFESIYQFPSSVNPGNGLISRETLMADPELLRWLSRRHRLAIATGRPKVEAAYPLKRFNLQDAFSTVLTLDDCMLEETQQAIKTGERPSLSKPHPFMLNVIARQFAGKVNRHYYIGDMPDDMLAAKQASATFIGIGKLTPASNAQRGRLRLMEAGADYVIEDLAELKLILA
jgi:HAD superfamily hydrolase (TIGR01548 family)